MDVRPNLDRSIVNVYTYFKKHKSYILCVMEGFTLIRNIQIKPTQNIHMKCMLVSNILVGLTFCSRNFIRVKK